MTGGGNANASPSTFNGTAAGTNVTVTKNDGYTVSQAAVANFTTTYSAGCTNANGVGDGLTVNCVVTNTYAGGGNQTGTVKVIKTVTGGGPKTASDFTLTASVTGGSATPPSVTGSTTGVDMVITANKTYSITEAAVTDYTPSYSAACSGQINAGQTLTCTVTNAYTPAAPATVKVIKDVVGGTKVPSDFTINAGIAAGGIEQYVAIAFHGYD